MAGRRGIFQDDAEAMVAFIAQTALSPDSVPLSPSGDAHRTEPDEDGRATMTTKGGVEHHRLKHALDDAGDGIAQGTRTIILNVIFWAIILAAIAFAQSRGVDILGAIGSAFQSALGFFSSLFGASS